MGREVKRVALDFHWPIKKTWKGYLNPHYRKCPDCETGSTRAMDRLEDLVVHDQHRLGNERRLDRRRRARQRRRRSHPHRRRQPPLAGRVIRRSGLLGLHAGADALDQGHASFPAGYNARNPACTCSISLGSRSRQ